MSVKDVSVPEPEGQPIDLTKKEGQESYADKLLEVQRKVTEQKLIQQALGVESSSLGPAIITKSMDITDKTIARQDGQLADLRKEREELDNKLHRERLEFFTQFFADKESRLKELEERITRASQQSQTGSAPIEVYKQIRGELVGLFNEMEQFKKETMGAPISTGLDASTAIQLKQMELEQARILAQIQENQLKQQREWELEKMKWEDDKNLRWAEFHHGEKVQQGAWSGLSDLAGALVENIQLAKQGVAAQQPQPIQEQPQQKEPDLQVAITSFPCPACKTMIEVPDGAAEVICPNEECLATFKVERQV